MKYNCALLTALFLLLLISNVSNAALSFNQTGTSVSGFDFSKIFNGLSLPATDFTKNTQQINKDISNLPLQKYKTDTTQFFSSFGQNTLLRGIYSFFITIIKFIAGIIIWILEFILAIIRRGLSVIS